MLQKNKLRKGGVKIARKLRVQTAYWPLCAKIENYVLAPGRQVRALDR